MNKLLFLVFFSALFLRAGFFQEVAQANDGVQVNEYKSEVALATAINIMIRSTRAKYTSDVVEKLEHDGTGASVDFRKQRGYIALPAQHIRAIAKEAFIIQTQEKHKVFTFFLRSQWNLNPEQGLSDDFEKNGWEFLEKQQINARKLGIPYKNITWKPYTRITHKNGQKILRYLAADPASATACITCHNAWEHKPEVQKFRKTQGMEAGKIFKMHELMGAISINVFLEK